MAVIVILNLSFLSQFFSRDLDTDIEKAIAIDVYGTKRIGKRRCRTLSEALRNPPTRYSMLVANFAVAVFSSFCLVDPPLVAVVWIAAASLQIVASTDWWKFAHEVSAYFLSELMLLVQIAVCLVYLQPQYPPALWISFLALQLAMCALFGLHIWLAALIRNMDPLSKEQEIAATCEFTRLAIIEVATYNLFGATLCLV